MWLNGTWGASGFSTVYNISPTKDISSCHFIEFDFYVENYENFLNYTTTGMYPTFMTGSNVDNQNYRYVLKNYVTKSGWNHVVLDLSTYDSKTNTSPNFAALNHIRLRYNTSNNAYANEYYAIANVYATKIAAPELPENTTVSSTAKVFNTYGSNTSNIRTITKVFDAPLDLSTADYIEFDIYVENVAHFWEYQESMQNADAHYFSFYLTSLANYEPWASGDYLTGQKAVYRRFVEFKDQITKDGWNHVKIAVGDWNVGKDGGLSSIVRAGFFTIRGAANTLYTTENIGFANVCGTLAEYKIAPELPENAIVSSTDKVLNVYGNNCSNIVSITKVFDAPLDLSTADYIEFDIYVENVAHFWEYQENMQNNDAHYFSFYLTSLANNEPWQSGGNYLTGQKAVYRRFVEFKDQITKDGWNHVKIAVGDWNVGKDGGLSSIVRAGFFTTRGATNTLYTTENIGFANVCGTVDITVPTEVMKNKIDFIGATLNTIKFDAYGVYSADLEKSVDISGDLMMIELDVFVSGDALTKFEVELVDNADGYAVYSFEDLSAGWNRLAIRLSDSTEGEADFANITGYAFYGTANTSVIVSNFYAAAYVKGDGNRDGLMDIRDLVAMKKYSVGITLSSGMVGNKVAMDVAGNDYNVNSLDLSELRRYFLTDKWSEN